MRQAKCLTTLNPLFFFCKRHDEPIWPCSVWSSWIEYFSDRMKFRFDKKKTTMQICTECFECFVCVFPKRIYDYDISVSKFDIPTSRFEKICNISFIHSTYCTEIITFNLKRGSTMFVSQIRKLLLITLKAFCINKSPIYFF